MAPTDQHFTSKKLALKVVSAITINNVKAVADFAAGRGDLLAVASDRWPNVFMLGIDRDKAMIDELQKRNLPGSWVLGDFLSPEFERQSSSSLFPKKFDAVVLNPPFSILGNGLFEVSFEGKNYRCSIALAFIVRSLKWLRYGGMISAVIPHGLLHSSRDSELLTSIRRRWCFEIIEDDLRREFKSCDVRCAIIGIRKIKSSYDVSDLAVLSRWRDYVHRGNVDHVLHKNKFSRSAARREVVHITNLKGGIIKGKFASINDKVIGFSAYSSPVVVVPRVGRIRLDKVVLVGDPSGVVFTKCIIVIKSRDLEHARIVKNAIVDNWIDFLKCYGGTGAQYTTMALIVRFLEKYIPWE